jgi:outer membrane protein assembly factor BamB
MGLSRARASDGPDHHLRATDGKWKWMQSREVPVNFTIRGVASPVLDGDRVLVGFSDGYFIGYNKTDGSEVFKTLLEKGERFLDIDGTPIVDGANIYVASYSGTFYCLARDNASIQWTYRRGSVQHAAVVGERIFIGDDQGFVQALNKQTGELYWSFDLRENDLKRSIVKSSRRRLKVPTNPVPFNDLILVASSSGYVYALDQMVGQEKWVFWPGFGVTTEIVTQGNSIYIHTNFGNLYCLKPNYHFQSLNR